MKILFWLGITTAWGVNGSQHWKVENNRGLQALLEMTSLNWENIVKVTDDNKDYKLPAIR